MHLSVFRFHMIEHFWIYLLMISLPALVRMRNAIIEVHLLLDSLVGQKDKQGLSNYVSMSVVRVSTKISC